MKTLKWNSTRLSALAGASAIAVIVAAGCGGNNDANNTAADTAGTVDSAVNSAGRAVDNAGEAVATGASNAGEAVATGAKNAAGAAKNLDDAAVVTPKVKTALGNNAALKGTKIDVDTTDQNVTLTGTAKTQAQKGVAAAIAKKNAPGYNIVNNIKVSK